MSDKARILFVDDEKRVLNAMRGLFRRDYELFLANEGREAVRIASENDIDVIVADQRMPGMTGIEVLAKIKEQSPRTVRILLTGYADPSAVEGSINIGEVFRFLSKPCPPKMLRETLSLAISAARTSPAAAAESEPAPESTATPAAPAAAAAEPAPATPAADAPANADTAAPSAWSAAGMPDRRTSTPSFQLPDADAPAATSDEASINDDEDTQPALRVLDESAMREQEQRSSQWKSVTNVVMSEDNVEETRNSPALTSSSAAMKDVGVVVFTIDSEFAATAIRAVSTERNTMVATTLIKVAEAVTEHNAGVLVTDFTSNKTTLQKIIGVLKKHVPELVTIAVSDGRDTTDMINLINYGQVFRYVLKPVEPEKMRSDINAAVVRHLYLLSNPDSVKRHEVLDVPDARSSSTVTEFLGKIRSRRVQRPDPTDTIT